jgi:hypothetical protein
MTYAHTRRILATIVAASCIAVPAFASASDGTDSSDRTDAAQSGSTASLASSDRTDAAQSGSTASLASSDRTDAAQSGSTASPPSTLSIAKSTFPAADFRGGDTPVDHPGATYAPTGAPTTIQIVRPVRTIVRNVDDALPLILSGTALLLALVGLGITLVRIRMVPRPGHSH